MTLQRFVFPEIINVKEIFKLGKLTPVILLQGVASTIHKNLPIVGFKPTTIKGHKKLC